MTIDFDLWDGIARELGGFTSLQAVCLWYETPLNAPAIIASAEMSAIYKAISSLPPLSPKRPDYYSVETLRAFALRLGKKPKFLFPEMRHPASTPTDTQLTDTQPTDTPPTDTPPTDTQPTDTPPTDTPLSDTSPTDTPPTDTSPTDTQPTYTPPSEDDETIDPRKRKSMLKLIIGMAMDAYGHDPKAKRNASIAKIQAALDRQGIEMSPGTIRNYLDEGAKSVLGELPEDETP